MLDKTIGKLPHDKDASLWCYIAVRGDIPVGMQGAQAIHAAHLAGHQFGSPDGMRVAFLKTKDLLELHKIKEALEDDGIPHATFHEPDWGIGFSAIASAPMKKNDSKAFKKARVWNP